MHIGASTPTPLCLLGHKIKNDVPLNKKILPKQKKNIFKIIIECEKYYSGRER